MLQKIYQVILKKFPPEFAIQHNLHVGLEKEILKSHGIFKNCPEIKNATYIGALIRHYPIFHQQLECKFIQINIIKSLETANHTNIIPLYVTDDFLEFYDYDVNDECYMKAVTCYPLEKVVLGVKTAESFKCFQDVEKFTSLVNQIRQGNVLCFRDYSPLASFSGHSNAELFNFSDSITLDCHPFCQGLLTLKSSIILSDIYEPLDTFSKLIKTMTVSSDVEALSLPSPVSQHKRLKIKLSFEIKIITKLNIDFEKELKAINQEIDPLNTIFLSSDVKNKLNLQNGSWVKVSLKKPVDDKLEKLLKASKNSMIVPMSKVRLAHICVFSNKRISSKHFSSDKVAYISPLLWFNLNKHPSSLIQPDSELIIEPLDESFLPPLAVEVYACLIQSPHYDGKILCDSLLKKYFSISRFICKDDMIALNSKEQLDFHARILDEEVDKLKWPVVYFSISRVDGAPNPYGHLIKNTHTRLYQSGTKQRYVPVTMEAFYQLSSYHSIWNGIPEGLALYVTEFQELIMPFLNLKGKNQINCNILFTGPPCCGKTTVVKALCRLLNLHLYKVNCYEFTGESSAVIEARFKQKLVKGSTYAPCVILLKNIHCIGREREALGEDSRVTHSLANCLKDVTNWSANWPILVIGTALDQRQLSNNLVSAFLHCVQMTAPNEEERCILLEELLTVCDVGKDVSVRYLAQRTAGFVLGDLSALINQGIRNAYSRIEKKVKEDKLDQKNEEDIILASVPVVQRDLLNALEKLQSEFADAIGAPKIPNVTFQDIGGLANVKQEILDTIQLPLEHPEILFSGLRRSGVLLYGPPGSGKTLLAKAVATECSLNFLSVKGPELINMYVGQSEENVRAVFNQARSAVPCIIFFDELDSLAPNRGRSGDSGGVMDRVVSQLLAELDGLNKKSEVFVIGATNRPDLLDPALLRPGRFDRLLYVGIPEDKTSKLSILKALTQKFPLAADVNLDEIVDMCPPRLSGADFYSLCSNAVIYRVEKNVEMLEKGEKTVSDINCEVTTEDFRRAMDTLVPSVSPEQYKQYQLIRAKIEKE